MARRGLARIFGPPALDPQEHSGDPGLFGPGSATWAVIGEPAAIVGGIRSLLVQLLHPLAMAGVADHSAFRADPLGRLHRTSAYVTATAFGSTAEALAAASAVRSAHRPVRGTAPGGRRYRAGDPALLTWVSMALTSSFLAADRAYSLHPVDAATADRFVAEQARAAGLLDPRVDLRALDLVSQAPALRAGGVALRAGGVWLPMVEDGTLPTTAAQLQGRLHAARPFLEVNEQGREALRFLLWPQLAPAMRAAYLPLLAGAVATLEPWQRRLLGVPLGPAGIALRAQTRTLLVAMRVGTGLSPSLIAAQRRSRAA